MDAILRLLKREKLVLFFSAALVTSLVYSPFTLSVSMISLLVLGVFDWQWRYPFLGINPSLGAAWRRLRRRPDFAVITLFFFIVLLSGPFTEDWSYWLERLRLKLPFLLLPLAFLAFPPLWRRQYEGLFYFTVWMLVVTCVGIGIHYALHFEAVNELLRQGQPVPVPRNHVRFSLLLALGVVAGAVLYRRGFYLWQKWERPLLLGATVFLFFFIHLLAVRSGLAALYAAVGVLALRYVYRTRRWAVGLAVLAGLAVLPVLAYQLMPSFRTKMDYVRWDLLQYREGKGATYSDSGRLISLRVGMGIGHAHPVLGVGAGNLRQEVQRVYAADYPEVHPVKMPHNQFVSVYAGTGLLGLALFCFAFFFPLFYRRHYRDPLFLAFHVIVFCSFLVENTIENSLGIGFYVGFLLLGLKEKLDAGHFKTAAPTAHSRQRR